MVPNARARPLALCFASMPRGRKRARPGAAGVEVADVLAQEMQCGICLGLLCRPHALLCGHAFCGSCIFAHESSKNDAWEEVDCPVCRMSLPSAPPLLQVQMSATIDRMREACSGDVLDESLREWRERQARWDEAAAEAREGWAREAPLPESPPREAVHDDADEAARAYRAGIAAGARSLSLSVRLEPTGDQVFFRCLRTTELGKVADTFCRHRGYRREMLEFTYVRGRALRSRVAEDVHVVRDDDTGDRLGMSDGDIIHARLADGTLRRWFG